MSKYDPMVSDDPQEASRALAVYRAHMKDALPMLRSRPPVPIPGDASYFAVFLEWRRSPYAEFALRNVMRFLGEDWGLQILVPAALTDWVQDIVALWKDVSITEIPHDLYSNNVEFRALPKYPVFWNLVKGDQQLFFNSDAMLCRSGIEEFLKYDYIGSPWPDDVISPWCRVGSGGLSLRRKAAMLEICTTCNTSPRVIHPEDAYFSVNLHLAGSRYALPSLEIATRFAVERIFTPSPLGVHRPWKFLLAKEVDRILQDIRY